MTDFLRLLAIAFFKEFVLYEETGDDDSRDTQIYKCSLPSKNIKDEFALIHVNAKDWTEVKNNSKNQDYEYVVFCFQNIPANGRDKRRQRDLANTTEPFQI